MSIADKLSKQLDRAAAMQAKTAIQRQAHSEAADTQLSSVDQYIAEHPLTPGNEKGEAVLTFALKSLHT